MDIHFIERLERNLEDELPGPKAQFLMAPADRIPPPILPDDHRLACVLTLLYPKNKEWHVALIERTAGNKEDVHAGQLSFPGGKFDDKDYSYQDCALRETEEEIGVPSSSVGIVGELTSLYVNVSNFLIYPFVGFMTEFDDFKLQKSEVSSLLEIPLKHFLDQKNKKRGSINVRGSIINDVPYYDIDNKRLWGATAMIMSELEHVVKNCI